MDWKELLLNLGTPVVETLIANKLGNAVIFQRSNSGEFIVIESSGTTPKKAVYESLDEIEEEFPEYDIFPVTDSIYYLVKEKPENFDEIAKIENLSEKLKSIEALQSRITRHVYQLEGLDSVVSSLLEPIPTEMILMLLADALSELFVSTVGIYKLTDDHKEYELLVNIGAMDVPETVPARDFYDPKQVKNLSMVEDIKAWVIPVKSGEVNRYLVLFKREEPFTPEEKSLINALIRMLERTREYVESEERATHLDKLLSEFRFVIESLGEFTKKALSIHDRDEFESFIVDMLREMLQLKWTALYKNGVLVKYAAVKPVELPDDVKDLKDFSEKINITLNGEEYDFIMGEPITGEFLKDVKELYLNITTQMMVEAFKNMKYQHEIKEREGRIRKLMEMLKGIEKFLKGLHENKSPGDVYSLIYEHLSKVLKIKGMKIEYEGMIYNLGEEAEFSYKVEIQPENAVFVFYKDTNFSEEDVSFLNAISKGVTSVLAKLYMFNLGEKAILLDEAILRFLREKAVMEGLNVNELVFYKISGKVNVDELSKYGVCVIDKDGAILATNINEKELKNKGFTVEVL